LDTGAVGTPNEVEVSLEGPDGVGLNTKDEMSGEEAANEAREKVVEGLFEVIAVAVVVG
jgi:hypothetical protein